jgi:hypothetical protein
MSYLGRITGRLAPAAGPALTPAGRLASPIARRDQRLHALGTDSAWVAAAPGAGLHGIDAADGDAAITGIDGEPIDSPLGGATAGGGGVGGGRSMAGTPGVSAALRGPSAARGDATGARPAAPLGTGVGAFRGPAPGAIESAAPAGPRGSGAAMPPAAAAGPAPGDRSPFAAREGGQRPDSRTGATARAAEPNADVVPARTELVAGPGVPRTVPAAEAAAAEPFAAALADVLGKVHRWMASEPRPRAADRTAARATGGPGAGAPPIAPAARAAGRSGPALAPPVFQVRGPTPRLTVGRIDVQVLPPPAAPVVAAAPARASRAAAPAGAAGEANLPAYLTFGLRQR